MTWMIPPPFSFRELAAGVDKSTAQDWNETQVRSKPRASSLMNDAREVALDMAGTPVTDPAQEDDLRFDGVITAESGRLLEDLTAAGIEGIPKGLHVVDRQIALPDDYPVTGHPDGRLAKVVGSGGLTQSYSTTLDDGLVWGFEHKVFGGFKYKNLALDGLFSAMGADLLAQVLLYGDALGWDAVCIVVLASDASGIRGDMRYKKYKTLAEAPADVFHPKGFVWGVDIRELKEALIPDLHKRAAWFSRRQAAGKNPHDVLFESMPGTKSEFPWGWSEYYSLVADGRSPGGHRKAPWPRILPRTK